MSNAPSQAPVWLITGGTSGFGLSIAKAAASTGAHVVLAGLEELAQEHHSDFSSERLTVERLDVRDAAQIERVVAACIAQHGRIDVLVNNAGYALLGALEETTDAQGRRLMEVNFFGAVAMIRAALPHMRARRSGSIVSISSVGGFDGGSPRFTYYAASKFAIEGLSEALSREVAGLGIKVMVAEPASLRTNFRGSSMPVAEREIADYDVIDGKSRSAIKGGHGTQSGDPDQAARALVTAVQAPKPPFRLTLGKDAYRRVRAKLAFVEDELKAWESTARDIEFPA